MRRRCPIKRHATLSHHPHQCDALKPDDLVDSVSRRGAGYVPLVGMGLGLDELCHSKVYLLSLCRNYVSVQLLMGEQLQNPSLDFVAGLPYRFDPLPLWIWQRPIVTPEARDVGALISATHRDQHFGILRQLCRKLLRLRVAEVDSHLAHCVHDYWMDVFGGMSPSRNTMRQIRIGELVEESSRHL